MDCRDCRGNPPRGQNCAACAGVGFLTRICTHCYSHQAQQQQLDHQQQEQQQSRHCGLPSRSSLTYPCVATTTASIAASSPSTPPSSSSSSSSPTTLVAAATGSISPASMSGAHVPLVGVAASPSTVKTHAKVSKKLRAGSQTKGRQGGLRDGSSA
ncbi:MAG: hypothetical protein M1819_003593 [Sarea resinae]|nr:MAG: hypothetical protein M1819_003593 [Sarea resinae]